VLAPTEASERGRPPHRLAGPTGFAFDTPANPMRDGFFARGDRSGRRSSRSFHSRRLHASISRSSSRVGLDSWGASVRSTEASFGGSNGIDSGHFGEAYPHPARNRGRSGAAPPKDAGVGREDSRTVTPRFTGPWDRSAGSGCGALPPRHPPRGRR